MVGFDPLDATELNISGARIVYVDNLTDSSAVLDPDVVPHKYRVAAAFTANSFSANVPYNASQDAISQPNPAAGPIAVELSGLGTPDGLCFGSECVP